MNIRQRECLRADDRTFERGRSNRKPHAGFKPPTLQMSIDDAGREGGASTAAIDDIDRWRPDAKTGVAVRHY